jgi:N4-gp56 family major capsid protein
MSGITFNGGSVGATQLQPWHFERKALIDNFHKVTFGRMADRKLIPKNSGKELKLYHYLAMLDDENINDQGIDAAGVTISNSTYDVRFTSTTQTLADNAAATAAAAAINAIEAGVASVAGAVVTLTKSNVIASSLALADAVLTATPYATKTQRSGNLYGSSRDVGFIAGKLPLLGEEGGRVNRVGYKRKEISGSFENFGIFREWSRDLLNFDSDAELAMHLKNMTMEGAIQIQEDMLQRDLLNNAGVLRLTGNALTPSQLNHTSELTYQDLMRLSIDLDKNYCPKQTTMITGTTKIDTKVIPACRVAYVGSDLIPTLESMVDLHGKQAWIPVEMYAAGTEVMPYERGRIGDFRFIVIQEMQMWQGAGAVATNAAYYSTGGKYDVFPILVVGEQSFTTIGFQGDGKVNNFKTHTITPEQNTGSHNPYAKIGVESMEWWYGFLLLRGERLALIKTVARM